MVVNEGASLDDLSSVVGFDVVTISFTELRFGEPGYEPIFEVLEESLAFYELVFIHGDRDDAIVIFIRKGVKNSRCSRSRLKLRLAFGRVRCRPYRAGSQFRLLGLAVHPSPAFSTAQISPC